MTRPRYLPQPIPACALALAVLLLIPALALANPQAAGRLVALRGAVEHLPAAGGDWSPAQAGLFLEPGDALRTGPSGWAAVLMADESMVQVGASSRVVFKAVEATAGWLEKARVVPAAPSPPSRYRLEEGRLWLRNKNPGVRLDIETPSFVAGIRGTELTISVGPDQTSVLTVIRGRVGAQNSLGAVHAGPGEQVVGRPGQPLQKRLLVNPREAVQWTIPLPPDLIQGPELQEAGPDYTRAMGRARELLLAGEVAQARAVLGDLTATRSNAAPAWSLLALTEIAAGETAAATRAATVAVTADPGSAVAWLARSYARQSAHDLEAALADADKALALRPGLVPALVQRARLLFAMERSEEAWATLQEAQAAGPASAEVANLRGFLLLARRDVDGAEAAFQEATRLDPALGEPHLGLALAAMRKGQVNDAFRQLSTAVVLEPQRSLFVSYWGKMLYQVGRLEAAQEMLKAAAVLDPRDPTPHLYQALILRDLYKPAQAIAALNRAMALNDNRAVYRSRLLLDQDLAVKNVTLSLLYDQLGLGGWAFSRATASVKQDYMNASAHLFLAGALNNLEGRVRAQSNEQLLARILQPANLNSFNQFNEYTSFFEAPSVAGTLAGSWGQHATHGAEAIAWGAQPSLDLAWSGIAAYDETDGWRRTNYSRSYNAGGQAKWDPHPRHNLMLAATYLEGTQGDNFSPRFEIDDPADPLERQFSRSRRVEAGWHFNISPDADLLVFATRYSLDGDNRLHDRFGPFFTDLGPYHLETFSGDHYTRTYYQAQVQQHYRLGSHQFIAGALGYWGDTVGTGQSLTGVDLGDGELIPLDDPTTTDYDYAQRFRTLYLQDVWRLHPDLTLEAALYYDWMQTGSASLGTTWKLDKLNPRVGVIWTPTPRDTFRLAAFRYLLPFVTSRLDPTDVAGVTIFRNFWEGSLSQEADLVYERTWDTGYAGIDFFYVERELESKVPTADGGSEWTKEEGSLAGVNLSLNLILAPGWGLNTAYTYSDVDDDNLSRADRQDHRAALGVTYVDPMGFSVGAVQSFRFADLKAPDRKDEMIWITDAVVSYEFPGKSGAISLSALNIFDQQFNWVTDLFVLSGRAPGRQVTLSLALYF